MHPIPNATFYLSERAPEEDLELNLGFDETSRGYLKAWTLSARSIYGQKLGDGTASDS